MARYHHRAEFSSKVKSTMTLISVLKVESPSKLKKSAAQVSVQSADLTFLIVHVFAVTAASKLTRLKRILDARITAGSIINFVQHACVFHRGVDTQGNILLRL